MALSGTFYKNVDDHWRLQAEWSGTQSISDNTTTITLKLYWMGLDKYGTTYTTAYKDGAITINGNTKTFGGSGLAKLTGAEKKLVATHVVTVPHNDDGTKTVSLSAYFDIELTLSGTYYGRVSISSSPTLNTIPRASSLTSSPSWTAGNNLPITISRASSDFVHDVTIKVNGRTIKTLTSVGTNTTATFSEAENKAIFEELAKDTTYYNQASSIEVVTRKSTSTIGTKTSGGTVSSPNRSTTSWGGDFNIGESLNGTITKYHGNFTHTIQLIFDGQIYTLHDKLAETITTWTYDSDLIADSLYAQTPNSNTLAGQIRIYTYYEGVQVRDYAQSSINAFVVDANPTFTGDIFYRDTNADTNLITEDDTKIIQNKSTVRVTIPLPSRATGNKGATIKEYVATLGGVQRIAPYSDLSDISFDFGVLNSSTDLTLIIKAVDSRNNTSTQTKTVSMIPYFLPTLNASAKRLNGFEKNTYLNMNGVISPINVNGLNKNVIQSVQYRYRDITVGTTPTWDTWTDFTYSINNNEYTVDEVMLDLDNTATFYVEFKITDKLNTINKLVTVSTGQPLFFIDSTNKSVSVNQFPDNPRSFEIDGDIRLKNGNIYKDGVLFEGGTDTSNGLVFDETVATAMEIVTANNDVNIFRVGQGDGFGYYLMYRGTGAGNDNTLEFFTENLSDVSDVLFMKVWQDGTVEIPTLRTVNETALGNTVLIGNEIRFTNSGGVSYFQAGLDANDSTHELRIGRAYTTLSNLKLLRLMADEVIIQGSITQDNRIGASLQNGWVNYGGGYASASYYKDKNNRVHITGLIRGGTTTAGTNLFNLPSGYRPEAREIHITFGAGQYHCRIDVLPDGNVQAHTNVNASWTSLAGISFRAEN